MKLAKNFAAVTLLVLSLSLTSFAGDQQTPGAPVPPPPSHLTATSNGITPEAQNNVVAIPEKAEQTPDTLWYELLLGLLSVY